MSLLPAPLGPVRPDFLTRVTPAARLVAGMTWLVASVVTLDPVVPVRLTIAALVALVLWSGLPLRRIPSRLAPLGFAILSLTALSILLSGANADRSLAALVQLGPVRVTGPAVSAGLAIGLRVVVIGLTTVLVFGPSDPTRMADSLVQQLRIPDRFAYGTLGAMRVAPFLADEWTLIAAARRLRGIGSLVLQERCRQVPQGRVPHAAVAAGVAGCAGWSLGTGPDAFRSHLTHGLRDRRNPSSHHHGCRL